ncbi:MAG: hypothetical protein OXR66_06305 [Candidatus Woesearchaeota archaeon]|nr:hypothetical protein [Candidatus Woesearchaeota archaeon]
MKDPTDSVSEDVPDEPLPKKNLPDLGEEVEKEKSGKDGMDDAMDMLDYYDTGE